MYLFAAFLGVATIIIVTPGPDTALVIRNTLLGGRVAGVSAALGIAIGQIIWALTASFGILGVLTASRPLFMALKLAGAAYLVILGAQALREAVRPAIADEAAAPIAPGGRLTPLRSLRQGLLSNLGNPKMAVFFASLLPQFVPAGAASLTAPVLRGVIFALMTLAWLAAYSVAIARLDAFLRSRRRILAGLTGSALIGLGLCIAAEHH